MISPLQRTALIGVCTVLFAVAACSNSELVAPPDQETLDARRTVATELRGAPGARAWHIEATVATTPAAPPTGCLAYFTSVIEGHGTQIGPFTGVGNTCVTGQIAPDPDPPFLPPGPGPYATFTFTNPRWTLTAANGDELWLESPEGTLVASGVDNSLRARGVQNIVGGTGRFQGATGWALVGAVNRDGLGPDDFQGEGWIRY